MIKGDHIEFIEELILKEFQYLNELGYVNVLRKIDSDIFEEFYMMDYVNSDLNRTISVIYDKGLMHNEVLHGFSVTIVREPYNTDNYFALDVYLKAIRKPILDTSIRGFNESEVTRAVKFLSFALKEYCFYIINGTLWLDGYYSKWNYFQK